MSAAPIPSRPVTPAALAKWRIAIQDAVMTIGQTRLELAAKNPAGMNTPEDDALIRVQESLRQVWGGLEEVSPSTPATADPSGFDLSHLASLDTPDTRELLSLLERAQLVADRVDASRGRALPDDVPIGPGESRGCDLAEAVAIIAARVRDDVQGTKGRD